MLTEIYSAQSGGGVGNGQGVAFELVNRGDGHWNYRVIHSFCSGDCTDGEYPIGLIAASDGSLYGLTVNGGGGTHEGVAFKLVPNAKKTKYRYVSLYAFCSQPNCTDGGLPQSSLTYAGADSGALYDGVSPLYGMSGVDEGAIFELLPGRKWKEKIIYRFCSETDCTDGGAPKGLTVDASGKMAYGVTGHGGNNNYRGVIFRLKHDKSGWTEQVLHDFCDELPCADGSAPQSILLNADGNLYGVAAQGGDTNQGTAFGFDLKGMQFNRLYSFCAQPDCTDGWNPSGLSADPSGKLFGSTFQGGQNGGGVIFSLNDGSEKVLYRFCSNEDCPDGNGPTSGVTFDQAGNIYGATIGGGTNDGGTVFALKH